MAQTASIHIPMDRDILEQAESLFHEMGLSMETAVNIFVRQALRQGKIPFEISAGPVDREEADPFYSAANMAKLHHSFQQAREGKVVRKTMAELEAMAADE